MRSDNLSRLVADVVEQHLPDRQPPFEALVERWRRRRAIRRAATAVAVVAAVVVITVPAALLAGTGEPDPQRAATSPAVSTTSSAGRPTGRIPWDVTGVRACRGPDCRTVTDLAQVNLLVDDINASGPYEGSDGGLCRPDSAGVTLTFTGPNEPYPVVDVMIQCDWWVIRGERQRYDDSGSVRDSAHQAQRHGVVVRDCGVTTGYLAPELQAREFVGLTPDEARSLAGKRGLEVRVLGGDGSCAGRTDDLRTDSRVNLYLERGRVKTAAYG